MHSRIMLAGTGSGCGKTTITMALIAALKSEGKKPVSFKCGPDYIDPMFHRAAAGIPSYNLDSFFCEPEALRSHMAVHMTGDIAVVEAAMGYYDGIAATERASAFETAGITQTPVILIVNAKSVGNSVGAVISGFCGYRPQSRIAGVIFNGIREQRYADLSELAREQGVVPLGYMPHIADVSIESRHLGLVTAGEIESLYAKIAKLGKVASETLDIPAIIDLAATAPDLHMPADTCRRSITGAVIAVARDEAFCFMYQENLEMLESLGCELRYFSPLCDSELPDAANGLYLCGGYPELYLKKLSDNSEMRRCIKSAVASGMPTLAECGGFMYLHDYIDEMPMCGAISGGAYKTERLQRFGYTVLHAGHDSLLAEAGWDIPVHEFHYWESENPGNGFLAEKAGRSLYYECAHATESMYAGFPHIYLPAKPQMARRFAAKAREYGGLE